MASCDHTCPTRRAAKRLDGRYSFLESLGHGTSAEVYRARDTRLRRDVAIKVFRRELVRRPRIRRKFIKEAQIHASLAHANIVPIHDLIEEDGRVYMVMRCLRGSSLGDVATERGGRLSWHAVVVYLRQVLEAMAYAHAHGVIHQDLKPRNIQITPEHQAIVMDFGVAELLEVAREQRRLVNGSPAFMAPEQVQGLGLDARCDIYALGMTFYHLCVGRHPFEEARRIDTMLEYQLERDPVPPSTLEPSLPPLLDEILLKALAKRPEERFRSCGEMLDALRGLDGSSPRLRVLRPRDMRWDPRAPIHLPARAAMADEVVMLDIETVDLSAGGMALCMEIEPALGTEMLLEIEAPAYCSCDSIRARVEVVSTATAEQAVRVGVRWVDIEDADRRRIRELVRDHLMFGDLDGDPDRVTWEDGAEPETAVGSTEVTRKLEIVAHEGA